jgi:hypothetical protein
MMKTERSIVSRSKSRAAIPHLYERLLYWLYEQPSARRAQKYASQLAQAIADEPSECGIIFLEECRSLISEAGKDLKRAIAHRENEIALINHLHMIASDRRERAAANRKYSGADLRDRYALLAVLHHERGDVKRALEVLDDSKKFCKARRIPFEDDDLIAEYTKESGRPFLKPLVRLSS